MPCLVPLTAKVCRQRR